MESGRLFAVIGEALYGRNWQSAMAETLGVSKRAVRRWAAEGTIPEGVLRELHGQLIIKQALLSLLIATLNQQTSTKR